MNIDYSDIVYNNVEEISVIEVTMATINAKKRKKAFT